MIIDAFKNKLLPLSSGNYCVRAEEEGSSGSEGPLGGEGAKIVDNNQQ